jgi:hypothetical protein
MDFAYTNKNLSNCDKITFDAAMNRLCKSIVQKNESICNLSPSQEEKNTCIKIIKGWGNQIDYDFNPGEMDPIMFEFYRGIYSGGNCSFIKDMMCSYLGKKSIGEQAKILENYKK